MQKNKPQAKPVQCYWSCSSTRNIRDPTVLKYIVVLTKIDCVKGDIQSDLVARTSEMNSKVYSPPVESHQI